MDVTLEPELDPAIVEAVRASLARLGGDGAPTRTSAWWRAGVVEALERAPTGPTPARYEAARSPRSTRGATRA